MEDTKGEIVWGKAKARSFRPVHPRVVRWAEEYGHTMPYFIKVITKSSDHRNRIRNHGTKLGLPAAFIRDHYRKLDKKVILEDAADGRTWTVSFRAQGYRNWSRGWPEFSQQNNLRCGNIIVLALMAHSRFIFTLFNDQGYQIVHPSREEEIKVKSESEEKSVVDRTISQWHSPSCPKHYKMVQTKLEFEDSVGPIAGAKLSFPCGLHHEVNPKLIEQHPCSTLFVANLGPSCTEEDLTQLLSRYPGFLILKYQTEAGLPVAFVEFQLAPTIYCGENSLCLLILPSIPDIRCSTRALSALQNCKLLPSVDRGGMRVEYAEAKVGRPR